MCLWVLKFHIEVVRFETSYRRKRHYDVLTRNVQKGGKKSKMRKYRREHRQITPLLFLISYFWTFLPDLRKNELWLSQECLWLRWRLNVECTDDGGNFNSLLSSLAKSCSWRRKGNISLKKTLLKIDRWALIAFRNHFIRVFVSNQMHRYAYLYWPLSQEQYHKSLIPNISCKNRWNYLDSSFHLGS